VPSAITMESVHDISHISYISDLGMQVPYRRWLRVQFSTAFDIFLRVLNEIDQKVKIVLSRDEKDWRIKNACPACTYVLEGEPALVMSMLACMDGNNSLKRITRTSQEHDGSSASVNTEREDTRSFTNDYYLTRDEVNKFEHEVSSRGTTNNGSQVRKPLGAL
jgi:Kyakuja-Dileera-Zisupton transposase